MTSKRQVKTLAQRSIELEGLVGEFYIDGRQIAVKYFSTFASPNPDSDGGHNDLLKQLVPMRERVKAAQLKNLDSLLQRDLSDERIAQELIPYLQGRFSKVGFFPPILAVLLPKGFIENDGAEPPPYPKKNAGGVLEIQYGDYWSLALCSFDAEGKKASRLGTMSINPNKTNIVVLDGQHRSNAFRYVSGCLDPEEAYLPFYQGAKRSADYQSDLPVTLIWFESGGVEVKPNDVSRELFVAVNNSAKRVSDARTVLLDDVSVVALGVNTYYRYLARERGFGTNSQSLLSACFDLDSDLAASRVPRMALTTPVTLKAAFEYAFFGNARYDELLDKATKHEQTNTDRFKRVFGSLKFVQKGAPTRIVEEQRDEFREEFEKSYLPVLALLFEGSELTAGHYGASDDLVAWLEANPAAMLGTWWQKAFVGGEGLYSAFQLSNLKDVAGVKKAINDINEQFCALRAQRLLGKKHDQASRERLDRAFESFNTIAYQTGLLMAVDLIARKFMKSSFSKAVKELKAAFESLSVEQWLTFFNEFKRLYIPGVDPAAWPRYTKMLLRVLGDDYQDVFGDTPDSRLPDYSMAEEATKRYIEESLKGGGTIDVSDVRRAVEKKVAEIATVLKVFGLKTPKDLTDVTLRVGKAYLTELIEER